MGSTRDTLKRRVRKTVKWGGAGLTVLLVVVCVVSAWYTVGWNIKYGFGGRSFLHELFINSPLVLLSLLPTAAAWRADAKYRRLARVGLCAGCGYDRAGLAAGSVCPECGKQPEAR